MTPKLPSPLDMVPELRLTKDRNVWEVKSRSKERWWRVEGEARGGLMSADCPCYRIHKKRDCYHIQIARKFVSIIAMQGILNSHIKANSEEPF